MVDLAPLVNRVSEIAALAAGKPDLRWAAVTATDPIQIQFDAEDSPLVGAPSTLVTGLDIGDRVLCAVSHRRVVILGRGKGQSLELPSASETTEGVVERATQAEVSAGTDTTRYVSPKTLRDRSYAPFAEAAGTVANQTVAAGGNVTVTVTFPAGRFTQVPVVVPGILGSTRDVGVSVTNITTSSCQIVFGSNSTVSRTYGATWHAKQMTSGSGAG